MSGAPTAARSKSIFLCAVRWFTRQLLCAVRCAPDRHCRLSGAPISHFKKSPPARSRARGFSVPLCSLSLAISTPSPAISSLAATKCFSPSLSGEHPLLSLSPLLSEFLPPEKFLSFHPLCPIQNHVNSSKSKWCNVFLCAHCVSLQVSSSLGRVSQPLIAISPKP
jgi:hypothetical protein